VRPVAVELDDARLSFGKRTLWSQMSIAIEPGEFVAVLGANGAGKSSLLKVLLGLTPLAHGRACLLGTPARRGRKDIGYMPQQRGYGHNVPLRARDLVRLGIDGDRLGLGGNRRNNARVDELLEAVGASDLGTAPLGRLSGGEQQRLRVAQAIAANPRVVLCDEPLQSLDPNMQRTVVDLIDHHRRTQGSTVLFVTHEINPVLSAADRVLYIINGTFRFGTPEEVMTSSTLSELYQSEVEVLRRGERLIVIGADDNTPSHLLHHAGKLS
jgi:zinc/manganese transport system ATP-binding protein